MSDRRIKPAHLEANEENMKRYQDFLNNQTPSPLNNKSNEIIHSVETGTLGTAKKTIKVAESFEVD